MECELIKQGFEQGSCHVFDAREGRFRKACEATLKYEQGIPYRLIHAVLLSRPEHYLSIYQSGCNLSCKKCHSWQFTQNAVGEWMSPYDVAKEVERYVSEYEITFEVFSLYIPGWVETDQIGNIAMELAPVDVEIPFTLLAFFPEYNMRDVPSPTLWQMIDAYSAAKDAGLRKIRLGNLHVFAHTHEEYETLEKIVGRESL
ncbi:MAG: hypothetical protein QMD22_02460 [archaeon]|nr:hypothetical protein [archaeon]